MTARPPLENTTNGSHSPSPSPPRATAKSGPVLRHRSSSRILRPQPDSSESFPSPHSSIYEASLADPSTEQLNWYDANDWATQPTAIDDHSAWQNDEPMSWENTVMDSSGNRVPASFLEETPSPKKHTPHRLYPITEQNSLATLRTLPLRGHPSATSIRPLSPGLNGKKQKSFSTSDLPPNPETLTPSPPPSPQQDFYTPVEPQRPPPTRMSTPPSLPKFNTTAASTYRLPPPTVRFRDKFRSPTPEERQWTMQTVGLPRGVVMRGEDGVLVRGKFTPIRSGHFPPQRQQHALMRVEEAAPTINAGNTENDLCPRPVAAGRHVHFAGPRFEGPTLVTDRGVDTLETGKKRSDGEKLEKLLKRIYWLLGCCGLCVKWRYRTQRGDGSQRASEGTSGARDTPLFVGGFNARE